jgi:hypothetical protein
MWSIMGEHAPRMAQWTHAEGAVCPLAYGMTKCPKVTAGLWLAR